MAEEFSEGGQPIYRHKQPDKEGWTPPDMSGSNLELIDQHITAHVGKVSTVFHEIMSDIVHIDVHFIRAQPERPYHTLITSGMSDLPMTPPAAAENCRYAELMLCLPASWPLGDEEFKKEENYWPIRGLKVLARLPHLHKTWLWFGHTVPNRNPPEPFAANTKMCCWMVGLPFTVSKDFWQLKVSEEKTITFFSILPLFQDEMELKLKTNAENILSRFEKRKYSEIVNVSRKSVAADPWWKLF